jgi:hypothetical protein
VELKINKPALIFISLSFLLCTLTTDGIIGRKLSDLCEYLHLLTIGGICLLVAMYYLHPLDVVKEQGEPAKVR